MTTPTPPVPENAGPGSMYAAMLRISAASDSPVGLGFMVTDQLALTCAHVVAKAMGIKDGAPPPEGATVKVDLPLLGAGQGTTASIEQWVPAQASGNGDVAVLRLNSPLPGARPVRLVEAGQVWGHPVRAYGVPVGRPGGVWHSGVLRDRQGNDWLQADLAGDGYRVSPGFSGGPVWDDELAGVVGMMAVAESGEPPVSYLIPTSGLLAAWPGLRELVAPPSPFRGLRPFLEADTAIFHGRRAERDQVAQIVARQRWTTLVGPSGCGKSSLAMAGVAPLRRSAGDTPVVMRPGHHTSPLHALAAALLPLLEPDLSETQRFTKISELASVLAQQGLHEIAPRILELHTADRLLVVVDQFEELLDLLPDAVDEFTHALFGDDTPAAVKVLCTLRADFLEPMLAHPRLGPIVSEHVCALEPMRAEQLHEIITKPVDEIPGVRYQPNLAERILADAGTEPGALPLLGFTLDLLWEGQVKRQDNGVLTHHAYEEIGGVAGALGKYAERAWAENIPAQDEQAATRLLTQLVRVPIGATAPTRRIASRAELGEHEWRIAQRLAATRLLVLTAGEGHETVELAHEALITSWDRLNHQIVADRSFLDWRESLRHDLDRWQRSERVLDLLPTPTALVVAGQWLPEHARDLSEAERDYLDRGRVYRRRQTRRRRAGFTALVIVVVAALVLGSLFAYAQQQSTKHQAEANSRALAQASQDNADYDPALSIMTALAAYQTSPTHEARNQLLRQYLEHSHSGRVLSGLSGKIAAFHTSRDGNVVLAATDLDRATLFVHAATGTVRSEPVAVGHYAAYTLVSPDGKRAAFVEDDGTAGWFDVNPDAAQPAGPIHLLPKVTGLVQAEPFTDAAVAMSADGRLIAVHTDGHLAWWDLQTGTIAGSVPEPANTNIGLWIGPDDRTLLVTTLDSQGLNGVTGLVAVDMATGRTRTVVAPATHQHFLVSGDRSGVAVCQEQGDGSSVLLRLERVSDGAAEGIPSRLQSSSCTHLLAIDATGRRVVLNDTALTLVDLDDGTSVSSAASVPRDQSYTSDLISTGGKLLLAGQGDAKITYTALNTSPQGDVVSDQRLTDGGNKVITLLHGGSLQLRLAGADDRLLAEAPGPQSPWWDLASHNQLRLSRDRGLVADQENVNVVSVHETSTLRLTTRITTAMPPTSDHAGDLDPKNHFNYFFDWTGNLVTVSGMQVQQWDARTGRQLARLDLGALLRAAGDVVSDVLDGSDPGVGVYPGANLVWLTYRGDPVVRIVDLATGRTVTTVRTVADAGSLSFDPSGRYFALLRQSSILELWQRDPPLRELGPLHSVSDASRSPAVGGFLDGNGHYLVAANDAIRIYQIGQQAPMDSYEFGHPDGSQQQNPYVFRDFSPDGTTVVYAEGDGIGGAGIGGPLTLDPAVWERDLCRIIGYRTFTADEQASLPATIPTQKVCPATG
ncbi:trypsin-like peptidase domain-containing protein [Kutzneria buriramensis]|uniref:WD40 repeat protein n=1 Tax=Kutzneria buriramensis TaxID=1045776 RepID=A0A3E0H1U6_9PSEU|nr:trypsin-like peptidase domain-containing protein [Kutzneria buriramensis]REH35738.1 WD40 repeat protein [Kutzneria buriramensis]